MEKTERRFQREGAALRLASRVRREGQRGMTGARL